MDVSVVRRARSTAGTIEEHATKSADVRHQWRPVGSARRSSVHEHHEWSVAEFLDARDGIETREANVTLTRVEPERSPELLCDLDVSGIVHRNETVGVCEHSTTRLEVTEHPQR